MESAGDCNEVSECNVSFASLNGSYEGSMEVSGVGERLLSVSYSQATGPYDAAQSDEE